MYINALLIVNIEVMVTLPTNINTVLVIVNTLMLFENKRFKVIIAYKRPSLVFARFLYKAKILQVYGGFGAKCHFLLSFLSSLFPVFLILLSQRKHKIIPCYAAGSALASPLSGSQDVVA